MPPKLSTYNIKKHVVLGRTYFKPPYKVSDTLINEARIVHVVKGQSRLHAANQYISLQSGDTYIMKSDNFINNWLEQDDGLNEVIVFQLTSALLKEIYTYKLPSWHVAQSKQQVSAIQKVPKHILVDDFYSNLRHYLDQDHLIEEELLRIKIQDLLYTLIKVDTDGSTRRIFEALFNSNEYEFQEVIQSHLYEDLNLDDLAFLTGMSLSSFKRKFAAVYGVSPNKYFISKRLEKAQHLLRTTDLRISDVAYDCGYSELAYFTKTFQKHFSCTPSDFREKQLD